MSAPVIKATPQDTANLQSKPELIVAAARKLFLTAGYDVTSMDAIAAEAGVSKATVYNHFQGKEALFADVMRDLCAEAGGPKNIDELAGPPEIVLRLLGQAFLRRATDPNVLALLRTVLSGVAVFPDLGRTFWCEGPGRAADMLATYLADQARRGQLRVPDPELAAHQFFGLVSGPYLLPLLLDVRATPSADEIDRTLDSAVAAFMASIAPKPR